MPSAVLPTPQYISYTANILPLIGTDKILVNNVDDTAIPTAEADTLISSGESIALEDLSVYYVTVPALITTAGGTWETLPPQTYTFIYDLFVYQASVQLLRAFIERNTDARHRLDSFLDYFSEQYAKRFNRLEDKLPNGSYRYQLIGLKMLNSGIPRKPKNYVLSGQIGNANSYVNHRLTNSQLNWGSGIPINWLG